MIRWYFSSKQPGNKLTTMHSVPRPGTWVAAMYESACVLRVSRVVVGDIITNVGSLSGFDNQTVTWFHILTAWSKHMIASPVSFGKRQAGCKDRPAADHLKMDWKWIKLKRNNYWRWLKMFVFHFVFIFDLIHLAECKAHELALILGYLWNGT